MNSAVITTDHLNKNFMSDNAAGTSPEILAALMADNTGHVSPYGTDECTAKVEQHLSEIFEKEVSVFLVNSGTAANGLSLSVVTPPWGHVLCHPDSHIDNDECGAVGVFNPGSKLTSVQGDNSKINLDHLRQKISHMSGDIHTTQPASLSISQSTETGTIYTLEELQGLKEICQSADLGFHIDGARFANALVSLGCTPAEMTWKSGVDVLSFGTSKNGAMTAEAIILFDKSKAVEMAYRRKRCGHLTSKMRFLATQVEAYLENDLWLKNARQANAMAKRLEQGLAKSQDVQIIGGTATNIIFCKMSQRLIDHLYACGFQFYSNRWEENVVRLVTCFSTTEEEVDAMIHAALDL